MDYLIIISLGLLVGSFLNVFIYRWPKDEQWVTGRSRCMKCKHDLAWFDLVPLVSYLGLRGQCRYCKVRLSWQYPLVELMNTLGWLGIWWMAGVGREMVGLGSLGQEGQGLIISGLAMVIWSSVIVLGVIDLKHFLLPDETNWLLVIVGVVASFLGSSPTLVERLICGGVAYGVFGLLYWSTRGRGLGWGDVKLMGAMGVVVGWEIGLVAALGFVLGSVIGVGLILSGKAKFGRPVPFGPFLALGFVITLFMGQEIMSWYWGLMGI